MQRVRHGNVGIRARLLRAPLATSFGKSGVLVLLLLGAFGTTAFARPIGPGRLRAQITGHSVAFTWTLSADDTSANCTAAAGCSQTFYRGNGSCSATTVFTPISTAISSTLVNFTDSAPIIGNSCYGLTFTINGAESGKDTVSVFLPPSPPTGLAAH